MKESEEKTQERGEGGEREKSKQENGVNRKKGAGGSRLDRRGKQRRESVCAFERANRRDGAKKKMRARQRLNAIVLSYQDDRAVLLPTASQCAVEGLVLR